jgi:Putative methyltransferase
MQDWVAWHGLYDDPQSSLSQRLALVRSHVSAALDAVPAGPVRLLSLCAGQGRDVLGVLPDHARRDDVTAVLVEFDARNVVTAREQAASAGLRSTVEVREADAAMPAAYADVLPADVLLLCGIFGNVSDEDIRRTVLAAASMGRAGSTVIWTRHRRPPDLTVQIRSWFAEAGFDEIAFSRRDNETLTGVGVHRLRTPASGGVPAGPLFAFR